MKEREGRKFKRPTREQSKESSKRSNSGGGGSFLALPKNTTEWKPSKAGEVRLNVWPFIVSIDKHPDRAEKDQIWPRMTFAVHFNVGTDGSAIVCPQSIGQKCPICEKRAILAKDWKANEEAIKALTPQKWASFNIEDPDNPGEVAVFTYSRGKFADLLDKELDEAPDDSNCLYFDINEDGRTLVVRFSEEKYKGRRFLQASRFDFEERGPLDPDDVLSKVIQLDKCVVVESYQRIKQMFEDGEPVGTSTDDSSVRELDMDDEDESVEETTPAPRKIKPIEIDDTKKNPKPKPKPVEEEVEEEEVVEEEEAPPPPPKKKPKPAPEPDPEPDDEDLSEMADLVEEEEVVEEEEAPPPPPKKKPAPAAPVKKPVRRVVENDED